MITTNKEAAAETYRDMRRLLYYLCHRFKLKYGGDFEELLSEAHEHYVTAYATFDPKKGEFQKRISFFVWARLLETKRKQAVQVRRYPHEQNPDLCQVGERRRHFNPRRFANELSQDAGEVVRLALFPPLDILVSASEKRPKKTAKVIMEYLKDIGWSLERIRESFAEIREALSS